MVDVIIPTKNELKNLDDLVLRVHKSLSDASIEYLITFVDDHSNDGTLEKIKELSKSYNIQYFLKNGKQGKGYSIMEGLKLTRNEQIVFLDADLQYPPENLPEMLALLNKHGVVVANRTNYKSKNILRKLISRSNSFLLGKLIYNYGCDIQSGMKAFRRSILTEVKSKNVGKWTFDLQLLNASYHLGQTIGTVDINFENRLYGSSKVSILGTSIEIFLNALKVKLTHIGHVVHMAPKMKNSMLHAGMLIRGKK